MLRCPQHYADRGQLAADAKSLWLESRWRHHADLQVLDRDVGAVGLEREQHDRFDGTLLADEHRLQGVDSGQAWRGSAGYQGAGNQCRAEAAEEGQPVGGYQAFRAAYLLKRAKVEEP
eukprot:4766883-Prymnesium_polylepis.2